MKKIIYISIITMFLAGCEDYDPAVSVSDSSAVFSASDIMDLKGYTLFNDAVAHAGISSELFGADSVTVLAPSNQAFAVYLASVGAASVTDLDAATLANVLRYHTMNGAISASEFGASTASLLTGKSVYLSTDLDGGMGFNGKAAILDADMYSNDGIIHGVSAVLATPADDIMAILSASADHTDLVTELQRTGLDATLSGTSDFTMLAPNNAAVTAAGIAAMTVADATDALSFHVFAGRDYSVEIADGRQATILGAQADQQQEMNIEALAFNGVAVDSANYSADNGIVHFVGTVIAEQLTNIDFIPADFQMIIDALDASVRTGYEDISTDFSFMAPDAGAPTVASFGGDLTAMQAWLDRYTFDGEIILRSTASGTKVTTRGGDNFYTQHTTTNIGSAGFTINGTSLLSSFSQETYNGYRNRFFASGYPTPLPTTTISATLDADANYNLLGKAIEVAGKDSQVDAEGTTFYAIDNATFTALYGYTAIAGGLDTLSLSDENDEDVIADFVEMIDAHTVSGVHSLLLLEVDFPTQTSKTADADGDIFWGTVQIDNAMMVSTDSLAIITDQKDPQNNFITLTAFDIWASNGVIHALSGTLD